MNRGLRSLVLLVIILGSTLPASSTPIAAQEFAGGDGSAEDPYRIADWYHLNGVRYHLGDHFILVNDLDSGTNGYGQLAGPTANDNMGWLPIGTETSPFTGSLDGRQYDIVDLTINRSNQDDVGLFGYIDFTGTVEAVGVVESDVTGRAYVGSLVGDSLGAVRFCHAGGTVTSSDSGGGLLGWNSGVVDNCYSTCSVTAQWDIGGLVGGNAGTVDDCYATGSVVTFGAVQTCVGGLVGLSIGTVQDCYATGSVTGASYVGGLIGENVSGGIVTNCYATGSVTGGAGVGGLIGEGDPSDVTDSFWDTQTTGQSSSAGGTGKTTTEMRDIVTFSTWDVVSVPPDNKDCSSTWNIFDGAGYPFLPWYTARFELTTGWNLAVIPPGLPDDHNTVAEVFGDEIEAIYEWDPVAGTYGEVTVLAPLHSYWVAVTEDKTIAYYV